MVVQMELEAVALFVLEVCDYSEEYEDDAFGVRVGGKPYYVERHANHFALHIGKEVFELPR